MQTPDVKRTDLILRTRYPQLKTEIYSITPFSHKIFFASETLLASEIEKEFNNQIRPITINVQITNEKPRNGDLVPNLKPENVADNWEGVPLTVYDLRVIISGKFKSAPLLLTTNVDKLTVEFIFDDKVPSDIFSNLLNFLNTVYQSGEVVISHGTGALKPSKSTHNNANKYNVLSIDPIGLRKNVPDFIKQDEYDWFENLPKFFHGEIKPESFTEFHGDGKSCYIDAMTPSIDLRQAVLSYDTVYLQPPAIDSTDFWETQTINKDDILKLVQAGRMKLICVQPEERLDIGFIREAHECNQIGVVSRRRFASFLLSDIVDTSDHYYLSNEKHFDAIVAIGQAVAEHSRAKTEDVLKFLLYPQITKATCLQPLNTMGPMGINSIGQGQSFAEEYERFKDKDIKLESLIMSQGVHIAHALNATLIPENSNDQFLQSWIPPMQFMGERLNFYRGFNTKYAANWAQHSRRPIEERRAILPSVPLINFHSNVSIEDILEITKSSFERFGARSLIGRVSEVPNEGRHEEIERIKGELRKYEAKQKNLKSGFLAFDVVATAGLAFSGVPMPVGTSLLSLLKIYSQKIRKLDPFWEEVDFALEQSNLINAEMQFLSKINRVAELRFNQRDT